MSKVLIYPSNHRIKQVALVTSNDNQIWHYWCVKLGVEKVREVCLEIKEDNEQYEWEDRDDMRATLAEFKKAVGAPE